MTLSDQTNRYLRKNISTILPADRSKPIPLSFAQQRLWVLDELIGLSTAYHIAFSQDFTQGCDRQALLSALTHILARHEALRTTFVLSEGEPVQHIIDAHLFNFPLCEDDLSSSPHAVQEAHKLATQDALAPFDLAVGPLIRGRLIKLTKTHYVLVITVHHIIFDGWSIALFLQELEHFYSAFVKGTSLFLPSLRVTYSDYTVWQRAWLNDRMLNEQADYWRNQLAGAPNLLELPRDHARPAVQDYAGAFSFFSLDLALSSRLRDLSRRHGTTIHMTLLTAWGVLLSRLSGDRDIIIGTPAANRNQLDLEVLIGLFVNTLAIRICLPVSITISELLLQVKKTSLAAQRHQHLPFEKVVELVRPLRSAAYNPIFQVLFNWATMPRHYQTHKTTASTIGNVQRTSQVDLSLILWNEGDQLSGGIEFATSLFDTETVNRWISHFRNILWFMCEAPDRRVESIPLMNKEETRNFLKIYSTMLPQAIPDVSIHALFEQQAHKNPHRTAVTCAGTTVTYDVLNTRSNRLANYLLKHYLKGKTSIALNVPRSIDMIVAILAILKTGSAYVPLEPTHPAKRLSAILTDSGASLLIANSSACPFHCPCPIVLMEDSALWNDEDSANPQLKEAVLNSDPIYVMYTSGSTGTPKGVVVTHMSVVNLVQWMEGIHPSLLSDRILLKTPISFDASVTELFWPLTAGVRLVLANAEGHRDPFYLCHCIRDEFITVAQFVPSVVRSMIETNCNDPWTTLRILQCGGEPLTPDIIAHLRSLNPSLIICNLYGPTETTVDATYWLAPYENSPADVLIGRPIANTEIYILDSNYQPVPIGVNGELYISGAGVARGYITQLELSRAAFVNNPYACSPFSPIMYKTGDLGCWLPDGNIQLRGRLDEEIKIRGARLDLRELESLLRRHKPIAEVVVTSRTEKNNSRLAVYYTLLEGSGDTPSASDLRSYLASLVPEYAVPSIYVCLPSMPRTTSGKIDRSSLPEPTRQAYSFTEYAAPFGSTEAIVADIWSGVLNFPLIGRYDNFFDLGGHSLTAVKVILRLRDRFIVAVTAIDLFIYPRLCDLSRRILDLQLSAFRTDDLAKLMKVVPPKDSI